MIQKFSCNIQAELSNQNFIKYIFFKYALALPRKKYCFPSFLEIIMDYR